MRKICLFLVMVVFLGSAATSCADDEALAIIDKAIAAHGLSKEALTKKPDVRVKNKGTLHVGGMDLEFTQEVTLHLPNKFKEVMEVNIMGKQVPVTTVFDGTKGWLKVGGMDIKVDSDLLDELKEGAYATGLAQGLMLKDKALKLTVLGEAQVKGKPALGVRVSKEGKKDISFYFDKETGLLTKFDAPRPRLSNQTRNDRRTFHHRVPDRRWPQDREKSRGAS